MNRLKSISILAIGNELLDGDVIDSNSAYVARGLRGLGLAVERIMITPDDPKRITVALDFLFAESDTIVCIGGLGPTIDDLSRDALADFSGCPLELSEDALMDLAKFYRERKREFSSSRKRQAYIPRGALILRNSVGSAPGFVTSFERDGRTLRACALPGVPEELRVMFDGAFLPYLLTELEHDKTSAEGMLCTFGLSESKINDTLESCALGNSIAVQLMVAYPTVQITLKVDQANLIDSEKTLGVALEHVAAAIGLDNIYSHDPAVSLAEVVLGLLRKGRKTLAVAESCTGGLLSKLITDVSGASHVFLGGVTSYSNSAKQTFLDVPKAVIAEHGAVSTEVAERMAVGARRHFKSDLAVSVTGIAGPEGGSREKPVGTVFLGLATANGVQSYRVYHRSSRSHIRSFSAYYALDMIRRYVNGHAPLPETIQTIGD